MPRKEIPVPVVVGVIVLAVVLIGGIAWKMFLSAPGTTSGPASGLSTQEEAARIKAARSKMKHTPRNKEGSADAAPSDTGATR